MESSKHRTLFSLCVLLFYFIFFRKIKPRTRTQNKTREEISRNRRSNSNMHWEEFNLLMVGLKWWQIDMDEWTIRQKLSIHNIQIYEESFVHWIFIFYFYPFLFLSLTTRAHFRLSLIILSKDQYWLLIFFEKIFKKNIDPLSMIKSLLKWLVCVLYIQFINAGRMFNKWMCAVNKSGSKKKTK